MHDPSHDRAQPNERTEAPAFPEPGASLHPPVRSSVSRLSQLVHDLANWYQRLEAHLERLEREDAVSAERLQGLRDGLRRCAELGVRAVGGELAHARLPQLLEEFAAEDAAIHADARCSLHVENLDRPATAHVELAIEAIALENALLNLVRNARRACPAEQPISLRWQLQGEVALVQVVDRGQGMDEATLSRCLESGFSTKESVGHGIGLSGVRAAVEASGGRLDIRSELGRGTTVSMFLPLRTLEDPVELAGRTAVPMPQRVLVVDDDPDVADVLRLFVESFGGRARTVGDGRSAWTALSEEAFDAVLVDQGLPDLPGLDLLEGIRQQQPDLVLVLLTGDPAAGTNAARGRAVDGVGVKPLDRARLRALLEDANEHAFKRREGLRQRPAQA